MAIVSNNDLTLGLRGRVGKYFVFRTVRGKTVASHSPRRPDPRKQSDAQRKTRAAFREAAAWAVQTLRDPEQRRYFERRAKDLGLPNSYTAAVQQRMRWSSELHGRLILANEKTEIGEASKAMSAFRASKAHLPKENLISISPNENLAGFKSSAAWRVVREKLSRSISGISKRNIGLAEIRNEFLRETLSLHSRSSDSEESGANYLVTGALTLRP